MTDGRDGPLGIVTADAAGVAAGFRLEGGRAMELELSGRSSALGQSIVVRAGSDDSGGHGAGPSTGADVACGVIYSRHWPF